MAKFCGTIGYVETKEVEPGVWTENQIIERQYFGDLIRNFGKRESSGDVNDDINIANEVSIVADPYAMEHFFAMRYVKFGMPAIGGTWKIESVEVSYPRLILKLGGVYNGDTAGVTG